MKNTITGLLLALIICSCHFSTYSENDSKDIKDGERYLRHFYSTIASGNVDSINQMASDTLKMRLGKDLLGKISMTVRNKIGKYEGYSVSDQYTRRVYNREPVIYYRYRLRVSYVRATIDEIVGLKKEPGDSIKVIAYNVYSDLLTR